MLEEVNELIKQIDLIKNECLSTDSLDELSKYIILLSGHKVRLGTLLSEANLKYNEVYSNKKHYEASFFIDNKNKKGEGEKPKSLTNEEAKAMAEVAIKDTKQEEAEAQYQEAVIKNLWLDLKDLMDAIKIKINYILQEKRELSYNERINNA